MRTGPRLRWRIYHASAHRFFRSDLIDLQLYFRVLWRFKFLIAAGFIAAVALATLSYARVTLVHGKPHFAYRQAEWWAGQETLLVTENGFPEGRAVFPQVPSSTGSTSQYADPGRLAGLASFYARLATSDAVGALILHRLHPDRQLPAGVNPAALILPLITASPVMSNIQNQGGLPMLTISGRSRDPLAALALTRIASNAFRSYLDDKQAAAGIPASQRVVLTVMNQAERPLLVLPRKKTLPMLIFIAVLGAAFGAALVLERLRPSVQTVEHLAAARDVAA